MRMNQIIIIFLLIFISACSQEESQESKAIREGNTHLPLLSIDVTEIDDTTYLVTAHLDKGTGVSEIGFCWSEQPSPTKYDHLIKKDASKFEHTFHLTSGEKIKYVRAFATNDSGTGYSNGKKLFIESDTTNETKLIYDVDGNKYESIKIGNYNWMKSNLKVTKFNNGDPILQIGDSATWSMVELPAYSIYDNVPEHKEDYGIIYNGYVMRDERNVCPQGWHASTREEWKDIIDFYGGVNNAGASLKEVGYDHWKAPNESATNESGFTGRGGGDRKVYGNFNGIGEYNIWWTDTYGNQGANYIYILHYDIANVSSSSANMKSGMYVRCVEDHD